MKEESMESLQRKEERNEKCIEKEVWGGMFVKE